MLSTGARCLIGDPLHAGQACNYVVIRDGLRLLNILYFSQILLVKQNPIFPGLHLLRGALPHGGEERGHGHLLLVRQDRRHHLPLHQHAQV